MIIHILNSTGIIYLITSQITESSLLRFAVRKRISFSGSTIVLEKYSSHKITVALLSQGSIRKRYGSDQIYLDLIAKKPLFVFFYRKNILICHFFPKTISYRVLKDTVNFHNNCKLERRIYPILIAYLISEQLY